MATTKPPCPAPGSDLGGARKPLPRPSPRPCQFSLAPQPSKGRFTAIDRAVARVQIPLGNIGFGSSEPVLVRVVKSRRRLGYTRRVEGGGGPTTERTRNCNFKLHLVTSDEWRAGRTRDV